MKWHFTSKNVFNAFKMFYTRNEEHKKNFDDIYCAVKREFQTLQRVLRDEVSFHTLRAENIHVYKAGTACVVRVQRCSHVIQKTGYKVKFGTLKEFHALKI